VDNYKIAVKSVEFYGKSQLKKRLHEIHEEVVVEMPMLGNKQWMLIAVAFIGIMIITAPFLYNHFYGNPDNNDLFKDNFGLYPDVLSQRGQDEHANLILEEAMSYYKNKDFENALSLFNELDKQSSQYSDAIKFYEGICLLGAGKDTEAADVFRMATTDPGKPFYEQARWYLALTYLKTGNKKQASKLLQEITKTKSYNFAKAEKLLEKLE
jgi:tetratricopeptide (TPR) repeat protein